MAHREPVQPLITAEEYARLPDDPLWRDELLRGRLVREPRPGAEHGRIQVQMASLLNAHVRAHDLGYVAVESGFKLERDPDTVRGPDVSFVARERYGAVLPRKWPEFAPDLAVEILSPSDRAGRMAEKIAQYFGAGTRMVWLIDPADRIVIVHKAAGEVRVLRDEEHVIGGDVVPGFRCVLSDLFD
ncbi:MAG: Uma2 family endonuclease [Gemmatimonadota bacterium]